MRTPSFALWSNQGFNPYPLNQQIAYVFLQLAPERLSANFNNPYVKQEHCHRLPVDPSKRM